MSGGRPRLDLTVRLGETEVGRIVREPDGRAAFRPDGGWVERGQVPRLSLSFLARPEVRRARNGLPIWFENLLPEDGSPLRERICRQHGLKPNDSAGLLRILGGDLPGAVRVQGQAEPEPEALKEPLARPRLRFSLAGVQLKFSVVGVGNRFNLPVANDDGRFILKVGGGHLPELAEVEAATMAWARRAGFEVPDFEVCPPERAVDLPLPEGAGNLFLIRRFDRLDGGGRVHQEDFTQALEVPPDGKYSEDPSRQFSYDTLVPFVNDAAGPEMAREFVRRVAFVIASGNTDAHLKNWSFLWESPEARRPRLTPNYDLVSTVSWPAFGWEAPRGPRLALGFGKTRRLEAIDMQRLETFCGRSGLPDAKRCFIDALEAARSSWQSGAAPERMRRALATHWNRVPLLRTMGPLPFV